LADGHILVEGVPGLAKTTRLAMSHATGKIEILGMDDTHVFMKYHRSPDAANYGKILKFERNPEARWLDDYQVDGGDLDVRQLDTIKC